jgi:hypothetical protein
MAEEKKERVKTWWFPSGCPLSGRDKCTTKVFKNWF